MVAGVLALLAAAPALAAQPASQGVTVFGRVQDAASKASIAFLTVQLLTERDGAFVAGRLTDSTGAFTFTRLSRGVYTLEARRIGYAPLRQRVLIGELSAFLDLGVLTMTATVNQLGGVLVTTTADAIAASMDRKSYDLAESVAQAGGSVLQAMAGLPGITVGQDGKVQLRGSEQVIVLIDGKQTALTGMGSQSGLASLPASAIQRVEIISAPGARYDANGSAGIINLILKKEEREGFNGSLGFMGGAGSLWTRRENLPGVQSQFLVTPKLNPSLAVNYRQDGTNGFLRADWLHSPTVNKNEFATRNYSDTALVIQQLLRNRRTDYGTISTGVDHAFDARHTLSVSGLFNREKIIDDGDNPFFRDDLGQRYRRWEFLEDEVKYTAFASAVLTRRYQQPGRSLTLTSNYSFHREDERYAFRNTLPNFVGRDSFALLSDEHVVDVNLDHTRPLRQGRVDLGVKTRYRFIPVNMRFFPGEQSPIDSGAGGWATYREWIPALYANYVFESERVEVEGGLRVETVVLDYDVNPDHNTYRSDGYRYTQPFHNVRLAYKFDANQKVSLILGRRVDRPNEVDIRIFPKYDEPELIKVGNPGLRPQFTTSVDLGYRSSWTRGSLYLAGFHRVTDATITRIATRAPGSALLYNVFQNAGRSWVTGSETVWQQGVGTRLTLGANATIYRNTVGAFTGVNQYPVPVAYAVERQQLVSGNVKVNASWRVDTGADVRVTSVYLTPDLLPQGRIGSRYSLDLGVRKDVQRGRGEIVLNGTDILNTMRIRRTVRGSDFELVSTDYAETQAFRAGYTWKF